MTKVVALLALASETSEPGFLVSSSTVFQGLGVGKTSRYSEFLARDMAYQSSQGKKIKVLKNFS